MRLIAPTAFKGTMTPLEAARFLALTGDRLLPLSDGGDGFLECLHHALGGQYQEVPARDPFGRVRPVPVLVLPDGTVPSRHQALALVKCSHIAGTRPASGSAWVAAPPWMADRTGPSCICHQQESSAT
jgi:glycerate kinase